MKNIISILVILAAVGIFFGYIKPQFAVIDGLKGELKTYDETLEQVKILNGQIASLQGQIKSLNQDDVARLEKLIPSSIDNVKLIIDVSNIASKFGLSIRDIDLQKKERGDDAPVGSELYESLDFSFTVTSTYANFQNFIADIEKSLRLLDIVAVGFTPGETDAYNFKVTLRTYWLK